MKFSEKWLREWVNPDIDSDVLVQQLTMLGLEVDSVEQPPALPGVIVGQVVAVDAHPDANKLRVCQVDDGESHVQVVCGASNVSVGMKTAFATVGAKLPSGMKIKKARLRGVESLGMLCAADELALAEQSDGIMALPADAHVGMALVEYLSLDDTLIDIDITPNRGDCFCLRGIARDIGARNEVALLKMLPTPVSISSRASHAVSVAADTACVNYVGRVIEGIDNAVETPLWMVERLRRSGVRAISPVVDITNYVMLELGQPMHAFDLAKVSGCIAVRQATQDEALTLLDGREIKLDSDTTVIADDRGAIGIAGIMGGDSTGCDAESQTIFLESALFLPEHIAGKSRRYATHTESGHRFERGVDPGLQRDALEYASNLVLDICGGQAGEVTCVDDPARQPLAEPFLLRRARIERVLGISLDDDAVVALLQRLGVSLQAVADGWVAQVPSYRYDLRIEADLIEEIARVYGYDNLPLTFAHLSPEFCAVNDLPSDLSVARSCLIERGYQEVVTYSFVDATVQQQLFPDAESLPLANPISSDLSVMRTSLLPGLLMTLKKNLNRQLTDLRIFESGLAFTPDPTFPVQRAQLAGLISGSAYAESWTNPDRQVDFFDLKGDLEVLFARAHLNELQFVADQHCALHPGQSARIEHQGESIGWIGALHPNLQKSLDLSQTAIVFEINQSALESEHIPQFEEISRFPAVRRDIAILVDDDISMDAIQDSVMQDAPEYLKKVVVFDVYRGDKIAKGLKSVALGLILQDNSRTLEESEVENTVAGIINVLEDIFNATLRM